MEFGKAQKTTKYTLDQQLTSTRHLDQKIKCPKCDREFGSKEAQKQHSRDKHKPVSSMKSVFIQEKKKCPPHEFIVIDNVGEGIGFEKCKHCKRTKQQIEQSERYKKKNWK